MIVDIYILVMFVYLSFEREISVYQENLNKFSNIGNDFLKNYLRILHINNTNPILFITLHLN